MSNLMLHCGASLVEKGSFEINHEPSPIGPQHCPIPHRTLIDNVLNNMIDQDMRISNEAYATTQNGARFFGLIEVETHPPILEGEYIPRDAFNTVVGLRASHDMSISAGLVAGSSVFVCDNLCFSGEVEIRTKQTTKLLERLPELVCDAVREVKSLAYKQEERFERYQSTELSNSVADAAIAQLVRMGAINPSQTLRVINEWDKPSFEQFAERRDIWRLHNAVTETYKPKNPDKPTGLVRMMPRSIKLTNLCDELAFA